MHPRLSKQPETSLFFFSFTLIYIHILKPVTTITTIHSRAITALDVKINVIPGRINRFNLFRLRAIKFKLYVYFIS